MYMLLNKRQSLRWGQHTWSILVYIFLVEKKIFLDVHLIAGLTVQKQDITVTVINVFIPKMPTEIVNTFC